MCQGNMKEFTSLTLGSESYSQDITLRAKVRDYVSGL